MKRETLQGEWEGVSRVAGRKPRSVVQVWAGMEVMGHRDKSSFCRMMEPKNGTHAETPAGQKQKSFITGAVFKTSGLTIPYILKCAILII